MTNRAHESSLWSSARSEASPTPHTPLEAAYVEFRSGREGDLRSPTTLEFYDAMLVPFLTWAAALGIATVADVDVRAIREYRLHVATRTGPLKAE